MHKLSDNYYERKCFLKREQVPTQSVMIKKMGRPLANVYFKSMDYRLKVLAGLEPPLKGAGSVWFVPPDEVLKGRTVLKPTKKTHLRKLGSKGIIFFGELLIAKHQQNMQKEKERTLYENDMNWKHAVEVACREHWDDKSKVAAERNTAGIEEAFHEFTAMYTKSINNIETLLFDGAIKEIQRMKHDAHQKMEDLLKERLDYQAKKLYNYYNKKLDREKEKQKNIFIRKLEKARSGMAAEIHDLKLDKHLAVEKLRHYLEVENLACRVYVALKERDECTKEMELSTIEHKKKVKELKEKMAIKDFEILLAQEKEKKREEFNTIWKKRVCQVVKKLQMFVSYCLTSLPEYADFFIDMEKLMLLQLSETFENPDAESIFEPDENDFHTPVPRPHPFYLVCDKGYTPKIEQDLCPKHCTSSASHIPVIVVNKRFIYAACDNFEEFTSKITNFVHGCRGDNDDFLDDHEYSLDVPVKYTSREQINELHLESSLLQIFQKERPNVFSLDLRCCNCQIPHWFCEHGGIVEGRTGQCKANLTIAHMFASTAKDTSQKSKDTSSKSPKCIESLYYGNKKKSRSQELIHEREPKMKGYLDYVTSLKCKCAKSVKKHLMEHLPPYMASMSKYEEPEIPNYEMCSIHTLRKLVKKAQGKVTPPPTPPKVISKHREIATQYSDQEFEMLCSCLSDDEVHNIFKDILKGTLKDEVKSKTIVADLSLSFLKKSTTSFATDCAYELRHVVGDAPELKEIFMKKDCSYD